MATTTEVSRLQGAPLTAWRSYLQSHAAILRELDAELLAEHAMTTRDYEVLLYLAQADDHNLPMSALAERTMLTRSGITRLIDGLVKCGLIERIACPNDARVSYAHLTAEGYQRLRHAGRTHLEGVERLFLAHFSPEEVSQLAALLGRLPGAGLERECELSGDAAGCSVADTTATACSIDETEDPVVAGSGAAGSVAAGSGAAGSGAAGPAASSSPGAG